ncbi:histidinol dehydrogenase [Escherichia coli]|uniref:histidinol dehydrogenase n=1 Tax=Escherichia coli TaxID=562 RepID=A0A377B8U0_ECOLX|nr:histidinol dehydrogenase [Escherichia coli]
MITPPAPTTFYRLTVTTATCSSLGLADFQKRMTVQELSKEGFSALASTIETLAAAERLTAHKNAVTLRVNALKEQA